jgi:hypothetical protein
LTIHYALTVFCCLISSVLILTGTSYSKDNNFSEEQKRHETNLQDRVYVEMQAGKSVVYLNEIIPLNIKLYINGLGVRNIRYPEFKHEHISVGAFGTPIQYQETKGGIMYAIVEFKTQISAAKAGEFSLGPVKLKLNIIPKTIMRTPPSPSNDFFGSYEPTPIELTSNTLTLDVLPLPAKNRPDDFKGAVGDFSLDLQAFPVEVKAGDPLTLKMTVSGKGNFNTVTSPAMRQCEGFKTYEPQIKQEGNKKIFQQILMPMTDAVKKIPEASFSFFSPSIGQYQTIVKGGFTIRVLESESGDVNFEKAPLTEEQVWKEFPKRLKERRDFLNKDTVFFIFLITSLLVLASAWMLKKRGKRFVSDIAYARRILAPKKAKTGINEAEHFLSKNMKREFYDSIYKTIREYLGNRFLIPAGGITADIVDGVLKEKNIDTMMLSKLENIFKVCDMSRYAPSGPQEVKMAETLKDLKEVMGYMERNKA